MQGTTLRLGCRHRPIIIANKTIHLRHWGGAIEKLTHVVILTMMLCEDVNTSHRVTPSVSNRRKKHLGEIVHLAPNKPPITAQIKDLHVTTTHRATDNGNVVVSLCLNDDQRVTWNWTGKQLVPINITLQSTSPTKLYLRISEISTIVVDLLHSSLAFSG